MGGEALRILNEHPQVEIAWATSRSGKPIEYFHRNLYGSGIELVKPEETTPCDAVFFALPAGYAMSMAGDLLRDDTRIIDLGAESLRLGKDIPEESLMLGSCGRIGIWHSRIAQR